ncbi:hypothetical protein [Sphingomonas sp. KC8]|uniref:hypothetical protein n=1 Tax=Sphingomonas sp. KC8 TaxID=1030157 RepID=UPI00030DE549|nr:hypothetical protein [Sphingomonas sp. KC8]ARS29270.1 hypothetical protein KC8_18515 [Sphingomonas sp. KC8]
MFKAFSTVVSALALVSMGGVANASMVRPAGNTTFSGTILATVAGTTLTCTGNLTLNASPNNAGDSHGAFSHTDIPTGTLKVTAFTLSGTGCGLATLTGLPYTVAVGTTSAGGVTPLTITGLTASTFIPGVSCSGNVSGSWNNGTQVLTIPTQTIGFCNFGGTLAPTSGTFTITN